MRALRISLTVLVMTILIMANAQFQAASANTDTVLLQDRALNFVKDVLPFNMSHYSIGVSESYYLSDPNDPTVTQAFVIDLNSTDSMIHVVCVYDNGSLYQCAATPTGIPESDKQNSSMEDTAARILQAYQEETGLDSTPLLNCLSLVNNTEAANVTMGEIGHATIGGVSLSVSRFPDIVGSQTVNGIPVPVPSNSSYSTTFKWILSNASVILTFDRGIFSDLQDDRAPVSGTNTVGLYNNQAPDVQIGQPNNPSTAIPELSALTILPFLALALFFVMAINYRKKDH